MQRLRAVPQDEWDEQTAGKASKTSCKYHKYSEVPEVCVERKVPNQKQKTKGIRNSFGIGNLRGVLFWRKEFFIGET